MSINFLLIVSLIYGITNIFKEETVPKIRAFYTIFLSVLFFLYLLLIFITGLKYFFASNYSAAPFLFLFFIFPFAIGNFSSYKKLKILTWLQIAFFIISLIYFIFLYAKL